MSAKQHRYENCRERGCERPFCRVWRECKDEFYQPRYDEGYLDGYCEARDEFYRPRYDEGYRDGYGAGYGAGEAAGFQAGYAAGQSAGCSH